MTKYYSATFGSVGL